MLNQSAMNISLFDVSDESTMLCNKTIDFGNNPDMKINSYGDAMFNGGWNSQSASSEISAGASQEGGNQLASS